MSVINGGEESGVHRSCRASFHSAFRWKEGWCIEGDMQ